MLKMIGAGIAALTFATAGPAAAATIYKGNFLATGSFLVQAPIEGNRDLKLVVKAAPGTSGTIIVNLRQELGGERYENGVIEDYYMGVLTEKIATLGPGESTFTMTFDRPRAPCEVRETGHCLIYLDEALQIAGDGVTGRVSYHLTAVPEPATWAMMIIGFSAAGSMVRGQRRERAPA